MENTMLSLKISEDMVKEIVSKQIQQAIVKELGNAEEYMEALISAALHQKVSQSGEISRYNSENKYDYLDLLLKKKIQEAAKEALQEYIKENTDKLKDALKKELEKTSTKNELVKTFVEGASKAFEYSWCFNCDVKFSKDD
jgi:histone H3/H4